MKISFFFTFTTRIIESIFKATLREKIKGETKSHRSKRASYLNLASLVILTACGDGSSTQSSMSQPSTSITTTNSVTGVSAESGTQPPISESSSTTMASNAAIDMSSKNVAILDIAEAASPLQIAAVKRIVSSTTNIVNDVVSADAALYSSVAWGQIPKNGFFFLNNNFGKGNFVNGVDYTSTLTAQASTFPANAVLKWNWSTLR